jgi:hypothetical protein
MGSDAACAGAAMITASALANSRSAAVERIQQRSNHPDRSPWRLTSRVRSGSVTRLDGPWLTGQARQLRDQVVSGLGAEAVSVNEYQIAVVDIPSPITTG